MYVIYLLSRKSIEAWFGYNSEDPPPPPHSSDPFPPPPTMLIPSPPPDLENVRRGHRTWRRGFAKGGGGGGLLPHVCFHRPGVLNSECILYNNQSWAYRSYKLSERSKAMSDLWFSERKKMSVERWANCQKKEFAHRSKRSLNLKSVHFEHLALWAM